MMDFAREQRNPGKHLVGIAFVIGIHVLVVWALMTGLAQKVVEVVKAPLETKIIQEIKKPPPEAPPPPPPKLVSPPPPYIPPPEVVIANPPPVTNAIQVTTAVAPPEPVLPAAPVQPALPVDVAAPPQVVASPAPPPKPVVRVPPVIDAKRSCEEPEYPSASRRNEETGVVGLSFLINVDGRVIESKIAKSSGFSRLDRAARDALSRCVFKPGTVDGKPEQSWANLNYEFRLD